MTVPCECDDHAVPNCIALSFYGLTQLDAWLRDLKNSVEAIANDRAPVSAIVTPPAGKEWEAVGVLGGGASAELSIWALDPTVKFDPPTSLREL